MRQDADLSELIGKTIKEIKQDGDQSLTFILKDGSEFMMYHDQDCCESVSINDIEGDLKDLVGSPILQAEENSNQDSLDPEIESDESFTWTFYKLATIKGYVTIRWLGSSNGYYSESVSFVKTVEGVEVRMEASFDVKNDDELAVIENFLNQEGHLQIDWKIETNVNNKDVLKTTLTVTANDEKVFWAIGFAQGQYRASLTR